MTKFDYESEEWQMQRQDALMFADDTCERCGFKYHKGMHVHHKHGAGYSDAVEVLCAKCHSDHHCDDELLNIGAYQEDDGTIIYNGQIVK